MNKIIIALIYFVFVFINDFKLLYQYSIIILVLIGIYYIVITKNYKLYRIQKFVILNFILYSFSHLIYILNDSKFSFRDIDNSSRFMLLIPLFFVFKEINSFRFIQRIIFVSTILTSTVVIVNYFFLDVYRGYYNSCISGSQVSFVLGSISLFNLLSKSTLNERLMFSIPVILAFSSVILSQTRGVIVFIPFIIVVVYYLKNYKLNFKLNFLIIFTFTTAIIALTKFVPSLNHRYNETIENIIHLKDEITNDNVKMNTSLSIRYIYIKYSLLSFLENPLWGSGRKGFRDNMHDSVYSTEIANSYSHAHNQFVSDLAMRGIFGFLSTISFVLILLWIFFIFRHKGEEIYSSYGIIVIFSYIMFFLTDSPFIGSMHSTLFFIFSCILFFCASSNKYNDYNLISDE